MLLTTAFIYVVASKFPRNSLVEITGITIVNKETYNEALRRLRDAIRRKRSDKWRTNSRLLLYDNAPAHRSLLVKDFLAKNTVITLEHSSYSSDLVQLISTFPSTEIRIEGTALL